MGKSTINGSFKDRTGGLLDDLFTHGCALDTGWNEHRMGSFDRLEHV